MNILKIFPIIKLEIYNKEFCLIVKTKLINKVLLLFKNHFNYQFKMLTCISGIDFPEKMYRFIIVYDLLSLQFNVRIRIKCYVNELIPVESAEKIFNGASW